MKNPLLLRSLLGQDIERYPVWLMRQAGRYMHEYRTLKEKHTFLEMCKTPELAHEISLQPIRVFDMDGIILFSDILIPLEGIGAELDFRPQPVILNPISDPEQISHLDPGRKLEVFSPALQALRMLSATRAEQFPEKTLLGFVGAPWTLAAYLIQQTPYRHFEGTTIFARRFPEAMHRLLSLLTDIIGEYALLQLEAGADAVQLFDTWGGILSAEEYQIFSLPYLRRITQRIAAAGGISILYAQGAHHLMDALLSATPNCLSIDWRIPLSEAMRRVPASISVQGNFDPTLLFGTPSEIREVVHARLRELDRKSGLVVNLGHGVLQTTPREGVSAFVEAVKSYELSR